MDAIYLKGFDDLEKITPNTNLVLGLFDGVHIGHYQLISFSRYITKEPLSVITFDVSLKSNDKEVLLDIEDKLDIFERLGVDYTYIIRCDDNFRYMDYKTFIDNVLTAFRPIRIFCGPDFKFGYKAQGDVSVLKEYFSNVTVVNYVNNYDDTKISSSIIKKAIRDGDIVDANHYLGYDYYVKGKVAKGQKLGRKLGYPTINLELKANYVLPKEGVYITQTRVNNVLYSSMTNVGKHPTVNELKKPIVETYILDFEKNIYHEDVKIHFIKQLRDETKFESLEELKEQLLQDEQEVRKYFF